MFDITDGKFGTSYTKEEFEAEDSLKYFPRGYIEINQEADMTMAEAAERAYLKETIKTLHGEISILKQALKNRGKTIKEREEYIRELKRGGYEM